MGGPLAAIMVEDTGHGMDEETRARAFQPYFTTKPRGKGTGLGLAMVDAIVRNHGGSVQLESEVGRGTRVIVVLPAAEAAVSILRSTSIRPPPRTLRGRVLVVDDEEMVRMATRRVLEKAGLEVLTASDGSEALQVYSSHPDIRLVLLDLDMPHMDGVEAHRLLRALDPSVRVLVSTGRVGHPGQQELLKAGVCGVLHKPYDSQKILLVVNGLLDDAASNVGAV
jgi:CheY-like chemotaxis protein